MKKIFTLLFLSLSFLNFQTKAQTTVTCNAAFDFNFLSSTSVKFTPALLGDSPIVKHYWIFGDGSPTTQTTIPTHTYTSPGTYVVKHYQSRINAAGGFVCADTASKTVVIQNTSTCNLTAYFTWQSTASNSLSIHFLNNSVALSASDSVRWTFGDGTSSQEVNPVHLYANTGTYNVCLRVKRNSPSGTAPCVSEICKTVVIAPVCNLLANFNWSPVASNPLSIVFQNSSVVLMPTDSVKWTFGDGTSSFGVNPMHTYSNPGTYTVCLRVKRNGQVSGTTPCVSEICKTINVAEACNLSANFSWTSTSNNPLSVAFQNLSTPLSATDSVRWTFGDGSSSAAISPVHVFARAGTYNVCLRVKRNSNSGTAPCVREICRTIVIAETQACNLAANFTWSNAASNPMSFAFFNTSTPILPSDSVRWTFGDGTSSLAANPTHTYTNPGTYTVCFRIKKYVNSTTSCVREICKTIIVLPTNSCALQAYFTWTNTTNPLTIAFQNLTAPFLPTDSVRWTFGDGTSSLAVNPTHAYSNPGVYTVCLRIKRNSTSAGTAPCIREICKLVTVLPQINCDSIHLGFSYQRDSTMANKIYFYANANNPIQNQTWTITKLGPSPQPTVSLHQNNPVYIFNDTGYYRVCLRAITEGGCIKEYCTVIRIERSNPVCELQAYPNPATSVVNVLLQLTQPALIHLYIYTNMNVLVREKHQQGFVGANMVSVNINNLVPALYTIRVVYGNRVCYARFNKL